MNLTHARTYTCVLTQNGALSVLPLSVYTLPMHSFFKRVQLPYSKKVKTISKEQIYQRKSTIHVGMKRYANV